MSSGKRRPSPLQLDKSRAIGLDEELEEQRGYDGPLTAISVVEADSECNLTMADDWGETDRLIRSMKR